jgi:hypothetical protein
VCYGFRKLCGATDYLDTKTKEIDHISPVCDISLLDCSDTNKIDNLVVYGTALDRHYIDIENGIAYNDFNNYTNNNLYYLEIILKDSYGDTIKEYSKTLGNAGILDDVLYEIPKADIPDSYMIELRVWDYAGNSCKSETGPFLFRIAQDNWDGGPDSAGDDWLSEFESSGDSIIFSSYDTISIRNDTSNETVTIEYAGLADDIMDIYIDGVWIDRGQHACAIAQGTLNIAPGAHELSVYAQDLMRTRYGFVLAIRDVARNQLIHWTTNNTAEILWEGETDVVRPVYPLPAPIAPVFSHYLTTPTLIADLITFFQ